MGKGSFKGTISNTSTAELDCDEKTSLIYNSKASKGKNDDDLWGQIRCWPRNIENTFKIESCGTLDKTNTCHELFYLSVYTRENAASTPLEVNQVLVHVRDGQLCDFILISRQFERLQSHQDVHLHALSQVNHII